MKRPPAHINRIKGNSGAVEHVIAAQPTDEAARQRNSRHLCVVRAKRFGEALDRIRRKPIEAAISLFSGAPGDFDKLFRFFELCKKSINPWLFAHPLGETSGL